MSGRDPSPVHADSEPTRLQAIFDRRVQATEGVNLERYLADRREAGASFGDLAFELRSLTGRSVSYETVRRWATEWGIE